MKQTKKLLTLLAAAAMTATTTWATEYGDATNHVSTAIADGVMTVTCKGDVTSILNEGESYKFTAPGNTPVYKYDGTTYTQIVQDEVWDSNTTYYELKDDAYNVITLSQMKTTYGSWYKYYVVAASDVKGVWETIVNEANANNVESVVLTTEGEGYATIDYTITNQMMNLTTASTLDLGKVQISELVSWVSDGSKKSTFIHPNGAWTSNTCINKLVLPHIINSTIIGGREHRHIPANLCSAMKGIQNTQTDKHESEITTSDNATCIEAEAFGSKGGSSGYITAITFNDGLRMIGGYAFAGCHVRTLIFPSTMEYIGTGAFGQGYLYDAYFLGENAPIVEMDAFGSKAYVDNNASNIPNTTSDPISGGDVTKNPNYAATRDFYYNQDFAAAVLHFRKDLTDAQRAAYTDITRDYHVFDTYLAASSVTNPEAYPEKEYEAAASRYDIRIVEGSNHENEWYKDGDTWKKWSEGVSTVDHIMYTFWNGTAGDEATKITAKGGFSTETKNAFQSGVVAAGLTGGESSYNDFYVGTSYHWPSQAAYCRSYAVATNNLLLDGTSNIAQGIGDAYTTKSYDINCDGDTEDDGETAWSDGSEYIGLHQFVLVTNDVDPKVTPENYPFPTIKGGNWYTFCYPVNMTAAKVREIFGNDTQVCEFSQVTRPEDGDGTIKLYFTKETCLGQADDAKAIVANQAYMIRPSNYFDDEATQFVFTDYVLEDKKVEVPTTIAVHDSKRNTNYAYTFIGQYMTQADGTSIAMPQYSYFLYNASPSGTKVINQTHKLAFQKGTTGKWSVNTCIVLTNQGKADYDDFFASATSKTMSLESFFGFDESATAIDNAEAEEYEVVLGAENSLGGIYNLNGQLISNTTVGLPKGIYVQGGKKFIVQ